MRPHPKDVLTEVLGSLEKAEEFALWAWGEEYKTIDFSKDAVKIWNERHGDLYKTKESNEVVKDLTYMIDLWIKHSQ